MRSWITRGFVGLLSIGVFAFLVAPAPVESGVSGGICYLSLDPAAGPAPGVFGLNSGDIPPDCSTWHELYPSFCGSSHQSGYVDNGDGCVSACDLIELDGVAWHVTWVGPTYYLLCDPTGPNPSDVIWEPNQGPHNPESPVCESWQEVWPNFGEVCHIDDWEDHNGDGVVSICDDVFYAGVRYHVQDIKLNIIIEEPTPTEESTWGKLKSRFKSMINH
jgi:hypothetical protein